MPLHESNAMVAARLVRDSSATYARALSSFEQDSGRGREGPRQGQGPIDNSKNSNKKNWAALVRPIFSPTRFAATSPAKFTMTRPIASHCVQEPR